MELSTMKKLIDRFQRRRRKKVKRSKKVWRYFRCENDILKRKRGNDPTKPFQVSCHRIPSNFYRFLVKQKADYIAGQTPVIDLGTPAQNELITKTLGSEFGRVLNRMIIYASNDGYVWVQYWINDDGEFKYTLVEANRVYDIWGGELNQELIGLVKVTEGYIDENGDEWDTYEYFDKEKVTYFRKPSDKGLDYLEYDKTEMWLDPGSDGYEETVTELESSVPDPESFKPEELLYSRPHDGDGEIPFARCGNNSDLLDDLVGLKGAIDSYDESRSQLADDIADCENSLFVLSGYGDQDPHEFWKKVTEDRLIKLVHDPIDSANGGKAGLDLLAVEPPIEALKFNLELQRKAIFEQGQGVDPTPENFGNTSGEALKHRYSLLDLKAKATMNEFDLGLARLIRALCRYLGIEPESEEKLKPIWKPTRTSNETELITNLVNSIGILSEETILSYHPMVTDVKAEQERKKKEADQKAQDQEERAAQTFLNAMRRQQPQEEEETDGKQSGVLERAVPAGRGSQVQNSGRTSSAD